MRSPSNRHVSFRAISTFACIVAAAVLTLGSRTEAIQAPQSAAGSELEVVQVRPNVYTIIGAGGNILVHLGWMGAIVVDTGSSDMSDEVLGAIKRITDKDIRMIIN